MRRLLCAGVLLALAGAAVAASVDETLNKACAAGHPWRLGPPPPKYTTTEVAIKLNGAAGRMVTICNCTADVAGKNTGVWVRASMSTDTLKEMAATHKVDVRGGELEPGPGTWPYYLPNKSCTHAGAVTVMLAPADKTVETWGTSLLEPK